MYMIDFSYDEIYASEYNYMIVSSSTSDEAKLGNDLYLKRVKSSDSSTWYSVASEYDKPFTCDIRVIKRPMCVSEVEYNDIIDEYELNEILRWLNRRTYHKFKPVYENNEFSDVYYMGTFTTISAWMKGSDIVGLDLSFEANAPYGFQEPVSFTETVSANGTLTIEDTSDEIGWIYPEITIKVQSEGNLTISNSADPGHDCVINNCASGEVLTFHGSIKQLESSLDSHDTLFNDFSYDFPRIINTFTERTNTYTFSLPCEVSMTYSPVRKAGMIV